MERSITILPTMLPLNIPIAGSGKLRDLPTAGRDSILDNVSASSRRIIFDGRQEATRSLTGRGGDGKGTATILATTVTPTSLCYPSTNRKWSSEPSLTFTGRPDGMPRANLPELARTQWLQVLCGKPQATWLRRLGGISEEAPSTSRDLPTCDLSCGCG